MTARRHNLSTTLAVLWRIELATFLLWAARVTGDNAWRRRGVMGVVRRLVEGAERAYARAKR